MMYFLVNCNIMLLFIFKVLVFMYAYVAKLVNVSAIHEKAVGSIPARTIKICLKIVLEVILFNCINNND